VTPSRPTNCDPRRRPPRRGAHHGFTLAELLAAITIMAVLAASAAPSVRALSEARAAGLSREVARLLALARAHAGASGQSTGVVFDPDAETFALRRIPVSGAAPVAVVGPSGQAIDDLSIAARYAGASVVSFVTGSGSASHTGVWFSPLGAPEVRDDSGSLVTAFTQDAVITFTGGRAITIRRASGAVER